MLTAEIALALPGIALAYEASPAGATSAATLADTKAALRDLWIGHIFWVRNVEDARFEGDDAAASAAEQQVVANAQAIAGALEPFYGKAASDQLFTLLAGHWDAIKDYLDATHAGEATGADALADGIEKQFPDKFR
jgi:hypothetical protein